MDEPGLNLCEVYVLLLLLLLLLVAVAAVVGNGCGVHATGGRWCVLWAWHGVVKKIDDAWCEGGSCAGPDGCSGAWLTSLCDSVCDGAGVLGCSSVL